MPTSPDVEILLAAVEIVGVDLVVSLKLLDGWPQLEHEIAVGSSKLVSEVFQLVVEEGPEYGPVSSLD